jgi:hypothetical protein
MDRPVVGTKKYYDYVDRVVKEAEAKLPISVYGFTRYDLSFHWILTDGTEYREPCRVPIEILEKL